MRKAKSATLHPPPGYNTWLDYAVEHLDTRELNPLSLFDDSILIYQTGSTQRACVQCEPCQKYVNLTWRCRGTEADSESAIRHLVVHTHRENGFRR